MKQEISLLIKEAEENRQVALEHNRDEEQNYWLGKIVAFQKVLDLIAEEEDKNVNFNND